MPVLGAQEKIMLGGLGQPIAYGRTAEIYAWHQEQILKLFYDWFGLENAVQAEGNASRTLMGRICHSDRALDSKQPSEMTSKLRNKLSMAFMIILGISSMVGCNAVPKLSASGQLATVGHTACQPSQIHPSKIEFPEIQGTMSTDGEMWALLFFDRAHAKLSVTRPSLTPAKMPKGAGVVWRLVMISESSGWDLGAAFASQIEKDVGVKVTLDDFAIGDLSAGDVLDELQTGNSSVPELEGLPAALANADVVLLDPSPMRSIDNDAFLSIQRCFGNVAGTPAPCTSKGSEKYTADLEAIWAKIFELRLGKPTILRGLDSASPFVSRWNENQIFEACTTCWECYSAAARKAAEALHIPFLSRYDLYNGVAHNIDIGQQGYIGADGVHPNGLAQQHTSELLSKLGYEPVTAP